MRADPSRRRRAALSRVARAGFVAGLGLCAAACTDLFHSTEWSSLCDARPDAPACLGTSSTGGGPGTGGSGGEGGGVGGVNGTGGSVGTGGEGGGAVVPTPPCSVAFGGAGDENLASMTTDASGNTLIAGSFTGTVDFGGGPLVAAGGNDVFAAKYDASCAHVWSRSIGSLGEELALSVAADSKGNLVVGGNFTDTVDFGTGPRASAGATDIFVFELDGATGSTAWVGTFGSVGADVARGVTVDAANNVLATGDFTNSVTFGGPTLVSAGGADVFIVKFDPAGAFVWSVRAGNAADQNGFSVATDPANNVAVSGNFKGAINFGAGQLVSAGMNDIFVVKLDPDGVTLWNRQYGDLAGQNGNNIAVGGDGSIAISSIFDGTVDFGGGPLTSAGGTNTYVAKLTADGDHVWSKAFGSASGSQSRTVTVSAAGDVTIAGNFAGTIDFGDGVRASAGGLDGYAASFTPSGVLRAAVQFGDAVDQTATDARIDALGNLVVAGNFAGTIDLGSGPLVSAGGNDMVVARLPAP